MVVRSVDRSNDREVVRQVIYDRSQNSITWFLPVRATLEMFVVYRADLKDERYGVRFQCHQLARHRPTEWYMIKNKKRVMQRASRFIDFV